MYRRSGANVIYTPWRSRSVSDLLPPALGATEWDQLLVRLGLTDAEALAAVREGREAGQAIRNFVRWAFREHFVPEDVLLAMKLRDAGEAQL